MPPKTHVFFALLSDQVLAITFYLGKWFTGLLYLFSFGIFGIGWFIDLFTLGTQVDVYNALYGGYFGNRNTNTNTNNNVVTVHVHERPKA